MRHEISFVVDGTMCDRYEPKANPLSCFKGQCDMRRPYHQAQVTYRAITETSDKSFDFFADLIGYLNSDSDGEKVHTIMGYVNGNRQNIYVQLKAIED